MIKLYVAEDDIMINKENTLSIEQTSNTELAKTSYRSDTVGKSSL
jgi:hypothetical protein